MGLFDLICGRRGAAVCQRVLQVDQHHHAELGRHARERDHADAGRDRLVEAEQVERPDRAGEREGQGGHDQRRLVEAAEGDVEQDEDDQERGRHDLLQAGQGALQVLELAGVGQADASPSQPGLALPS